MDIPHYEHKYLTVFDNESDYTAKESTFEEVNYSVIKSPDETPENEKDYYPSHRTTNNDNKYIMKYWDSDITKTKFFLEIVWGYFGWEWNDYTYNDEVLHGGNLYKVKETNIVRSIIDGNRLYHINDFLNSQDKITTVESFDTSNIVTADRAYKRISNINIIFTSTKYQNTYAPLLILNQADYPALKSAEEMFFCSRFKVVDTTEGVNLSMPNLISAKGFVKGAWIEDNFILNAPLLKSLDFGFHWANLKAPSIDINEYFTDDTINNIKSWRYAFSGAVFFYPSGDDNNPHVISLDLSNVNHDGEALDLTGLFDSIGTYNSSDYGRNKNLTINLSVNGQYNLDYAFRNILGRESNHNVHLTNTTQETWFNDSDITNYNAKGVGFGTCNFNVSDNFAGCTSMNYTFAYNEFDTLPPITTTTTTTTTGIYFKCRFLGGISFDFSPNKTIVESKGQFNSCYIEGDIDFKNFDCLRNIEFTNVTSDTPKDFPYIFHNSDYQYNEDGTPYQTINCSNSIIINSIPEQDLYLDNDSDCNPFRYIPNIDFNSNCHWYYKDFIQPSTNSGETIKNRNFDFTGNTNLTETPQFYISSDIGTVNYDYHRINFNFQKLNKLHTINIAQLNETGSLHISSSDKIDCTDCEELIYFKLYSDNSKKPKFNNINFTGCKKLDVETLIESFRHIARNNILYLQQSVWDKLDDDQKQVISSVCDTISIIQE